MLKKLASFIMTTDAPLSGSTGTTPQFHIQENVSSGYLDPHLTNTELRIFNAIPGLCEDFHEFIGVS
jgi:hypothetical protein